jgi:hypothetical protein
MASLSKPILYAPCFVDGENRTIFWVSLSFGNPDRRLK